MYSPYQPRRIPLWLKIAGLLCTALLLSGCVYLRLLDTKNQIAEFDHHFRVEASKHFTLHFLRPTLLSDDFTYLSGIEPTDHQPLTTGYRNDYAFQKVDANNNVISAPSGDIIFELSFDEQNRLTSWNFSPTFLAIAPAAFLEASIRSLGNATIDEGKHRVSGDLTHLEKIAEQLPPRRSVIAALGDPAEITDQPDSLRYTYRFRLIGRAVDESHEKNRYAVSKLYFDKQTDRLVKMSSRFVGLKIAINYRRIAKTETD